MPRVPVQKAMTRRRILASAVELFGASGFANVSIDEIMAHAGLTRGGFYKHFATKEALFVESIRTGVMSEPENWIVGGAEDGHSMYREMVNSYLAADHLANPAACPLIRFPESSALGGTRLQEAYTDVAKSIAAALSMAMVEDDSDASLAALALCVGGMVIARSSSDPEFGDRVRAACVAAAQRLPLTG